MTGILSPWRGRLVGRAGASNNPCEGPQSHLHEFCLILSGDFGFGRPQPGQHAQAEAKPISPSRVIHALAASRFGAVARPVSCAAVDQK